MISRRITEHLKQQHWTAITIDLVIVVLGVFIGLQVNNWNEARTERARERTYLERLLIDFDANVKTLQTYVDGRRDDAQTLASLAVALQDGGNSPTEEALQRPFADGARHRCLTFARGPTTNWFLAEGSASSATRRSERYWQIIPPQKTDPRTFRRCCRHCNMRRSRWKHTEPGS